MATIKSMIMLLFSTIQSTVLMIVLIILGIMAIISSNKGKYEHANCCAISMVIAFVIFGIIECILAA